MSSIKIKRGTRAQLSAAAAANGLKQGELYHVTDENRIDLGTAVGASAALATKAEVDAKQAALGFKITVSTTEPSSPATGDIWISY